MPITATGIGSGLDVELLVTQLVTAEIASPATRLDIAEAGYQAELSAYGTLKGALSTFQSAVTGVATASSYQAKSVTSSLTDKVAVSAGNAALVGSYSIDVSTLAAAQSYSTNAAFAASTTTVGTGTLTIQDGSSTTNISLGASNNTLAGIASAINNSDANATASIINDGVNGYRLIISASKTGTANALTISTDDDDGGDTDASGLSQLSAAQLTTEISAANASFDINGLTVSSASNTVTDVIGGLTLTLKETTTVGAPALITVSENTASATSSVDSFITAYNDLISVINGLTAYDVDTQSGSILTGDGTVRNLESNLRNLVNTSVQNAFTDYSTLASLGITTNTVDGNLKLDATKLNTALTADQDNVAMVFASFAKATNSSVEFVSSTSATVEGAYRVVGTDTSTSGVLTAGAAISEYSYNGGANNGTFTIEIDGVATDVLLNNNDSSAEDVRADIQSQLSGVTVSLSSDILIFTSQSTGSSSTVEITAANTNAINGLGISVTAGTAGVTSASYTINGEAATIEDNVITGALGTAVEGLSLKILGNAVGDLGSVIYSHGIASQLDTFITNLLVDDGMIDARLDGIASSITDIGAQRLSLDLRAIALEKQYRLQFNNLETLIAQLNTTQSFLTTALSQFIEPLSFRK